MARVFISHSSEDAGEAARILEWLIRQGFDGAFLDFDKHAGIPPGADWERTLYREIARAEAVLLILTTNWMGSKWCFLEYGQARALGKPIFPLIESPAGDTFVAPDIQHLDLRKDREGGLERLSAELTRIAVNSRGGFDWDPLRPPFPGLLAYDEADAAIYFGRDDDIRRLIERLNARRAQGGAKLLALLGASGSGKSSLLRAGVLPRLKRDKQNWLTLPPFRPQIHPVTELAQVIALALGPKNNWERVRSILLGENLSAELHKLAHDLRGAQGTNEAAILISIDQGEELFGTANKAESEQFLKILNIMLDEHLPYIVLLTLRSDFLGRLQTAPHLEAQFEEFSLKPMPLDRVRQIIEGPAKVANVVVEDALVMAAMKDAATDDALPLLAFALRELYDRFGSTKRLLLQSYQAMADEKAGLSPIENAVRRRADQTVEEAKPSPDELRALKEAFVPSMVRVNAEGEYVRRPANRDELPSAARRMIERLAKARLLIVREEGGTTFVEVTHEALMRKWPLLRGWLDEEREFLIGKDQLEEDLKDWENSAQNQKDEALLSGLKLTRARVWLVDRPHQLNDSERKFIQASIARRDAEIARRERLRRYVQFGSMAAALILSVVAAIAVWQRSVATQARAEAEKNYQLALDQAAGSVEQLTKSFEDGAISNKLMQRLVEKSQQTLNELPGENDDVAAARAKLLDVLSTANVVLGNVTNGKKFAGAELGIAENLSAKHPADERWMRLRILARAQMSEVFYWSGDGEGALKEARMARDIAAKLVEANPDVEDYQWELAEQYRRIGDALSVLGIIDEAAEAQQSWLKIAKAQVARAPDSERWQSSQGFAERYLGDTLMQGQRPAEADPHYVVSVGILAKLVEKFPDNAGYLYTLGGARERYGDALLSQGKTEASLVEYRAALAMADKLLKSEPTNLRWRQLLEATHQRVGDVYLKNKDYDGALAIFRKYLALAEETLGIIKGNGGALYDICNARQKIGDAMREKGDDLAGAYREYEESQKIAITLNEMQWNGSWSKILAMNYQRMGLILKAQGSIAGALAQFQQCAAVKVNKYAWSPRTLWPPDVTEYCNDQIRQLGNAPPR